MAGFLYSQVGMLKDNIKTSLLLSGFSPWIILGAVVVLLPAVALMTVENINRQKLQSVRLMMEKGAALVRSFEAGTRMGMRGGHGSGFRLQRLLVETAVQTDIAYLMVVGIDGAVLADSRVDRVGTDYGTDMDLAAVYTSGRLAWRRVTLADGQMVFEVFGKFAPLTRPARRPMHGHMTGPAMDGPVQPAPPMAIFVGFRTDDLEAARAADIRHTVVMAAVLLLVGCTGVVLLFLVQNYRSAHVSLMQVRAFSDNLVARMPIGLVALDRDGRINAINSVAASTLGIDAVHAIGQPADAVIPAVLADTLAAGDGTVDKEVVCPLDNGLLIPMDLSAADLVGEDGQCFGRVLLFKDLSEVRALRQEIEKNRRLASVGRLAAGVAHEIRNPLSSIKGFATYFRDKYLEIERDQEVAAIMIQQVDRLDRVVGQLLEFSRPMRLHFQTVPIRQCLEDALRLVRRQVETAGMTTRLDVADDRLTATVDTDKINQVLLNLFLNALDAMKTGGTLTVYAFGGPRGHIHLQVSDTGSGIDATDLPHIFEPYFSTKKSGTGLGLAIVYNIVKAHDGEIQAGSRSGGGTVVEICLPPAKEL
ncbi:MAG: ATP-binding protein [Desulfosarcina sp.]